MMSHCAPVSSAALLGPVAAALLAASLVPPVAAEEPADVPLALLAADPGLQWGPCPPFFSAACRMTAVHGNPAEPNSDVFFKVGGGDELPLHWHTSAERMVLVQGELTVRYQGHEPVTLTPGTYAYGPPGLPHDGRCNSSDACILFIAFEQPVDAYEVE